MTVPSTLALSNVEKDFEDVRTLTGVLWPKREERGCRSTGLEGEVITVWADTTQSSPAVMSS